jgi:hypothetical protein
VYDVKPLQERIAKEIKVLLILLEGKCTNNAIIRSCDDVVFGQHFKPVTLKHPLDLGEFLSILAVDNSHFIIETPIFRLGVRH